MVATLTILVLAILGFISNRIPLGIIALGVSVGLWATGVLALDEALAGFGDPTVIFIVTLFIVSESLDATGVTAWAGNWVMRHAGEGRAKLISAICLFAAASAALITVNGAVAALIPMAVLVSARARLPASQMLLPVAFAAHAGSLLTLTGSPVNVIVSEFAKDAGERSFGFFEFAIVGVPLLVGTLLILVLFGQRLLPVRAAQAIPQDLVTHTIMLRDQYNLGDSAELIGRDSGVVEVVVPPRSEIIGLHLAPGMSTPSGDLVVVAAQRGGVPLRGKNAKLRAGDSLLLNGSWADLELHTSGPERVLPVTTAAAVRRAIPLGQGAKRALGVLGGMVLLLATGAVPPVIAGLLAVAALIVLRVLSPRRAYASVSWTTAVLIAGMIPLSTAFVTTGAADLIADGLLRLVGGGNPTVALLVVCVFTLVLGQLISNTATVLMVAPVAIAFAEALGTSALPFLMALAVCGAAAFLTPVATPANTMVMEPGGYRFGDYWKLGLPLMLLYLAIAVLWVPFIWPFS